MTYNNDELQLVKKRHNSDAAQAKKKAKTKKKKIILSLLSLNIILTGRIYARTDDPRF